MHHPASATLSTFDVVIIGAGAAGLFCAAQAGQRGLNVLVLDHAERVAEKIRISGGGRCNFTNREVLPHNFHSSNPHFCRSALSRYSPADFIALLDKHRIAWHEKHKGQLFCDHSAQGIIDMLLSECQAGGVTRWQPCAVKQVRYKPVEENNLLTSPIEDRALAMRYAIETDRGTVYTSNLVVATGGLSIPKIGATDWGYRIANQFNLRIVPTRPALVPLIFDATAWAPCSQLAGLSLPVHIETGVKKQSMRFHEDLLFTHRGLSGPAVLQISSYWQAGQTLRIDLTPNHPLPELLAQAKQRSRKLIANELASWVPARLADAWTQQDAAWQRPISEASDKALAQLAERLTRWELLPSGNEGYAKAEVTAGGIDTRDLSSQTMESKQPGLYFIGEVVDVTGWLGGYNFHWAWASAHACAVALARK